MFSVQDVGLRPKALMASFGTILFITGMCSVMVTNILEVQSIMAGITGNSTGMNQVSQLESTFLRMDQSITSYAVTSNRASLNKYNSEVAKFNSATRDIASSGLNTEEKQLLKDVQATVSDWQSQVVSPIIAANTASSRSRVRQETLSLSSSSAEKLNDQINSFLGSQVATISGVNNKIDGLITQGLGVIALGLLISLVGSAVVSFVLASSIINLFKRIFTHLDKFSTSELEALDKDFTNVIAEMNGAVSGVIRSAQNLVQSNSTLKKNVSEQASSVEQTSASIEEISSMTENNVVEARKMQDIANTMQEQMNELDQAMVQITESNKKIEQLTTIIQEIEEKTAIIDDIVFQTKLLSFNASVEAERAGEHGRGFAVVAQEVGNLAKMSGSAALEIANIVKDSTQKAAVISSENKKKVELGNDIVKETQKQAALISAGAAGLSNASNEQSIGIGEINRAISIINKATIESSSIAEKNSQAGESLSRQSDKLIAEINRLNSFLQSAREKSGGSSSVESTYAQPVENDASNVISMERLKKVQLQDPEDYEEHEVKWENL